MDAGDSHHWRGFSRAQVACPLVTTGGAAVIAGAWLPWDFARHEGDTYVLSGASSDVLGLGIAVTLVGLLLVALGGVGIVRRGHGRLGRRATVAAALLAAVVVTPLVHTLVVDPGTMDVQLPSHVAHLGDPTLGLVALGPGCCDVHPLPYSYDNAVVTPAFGLLVLIAGAAEALVGAALLVFGTRTGRSRDSVAVLPLVIVAGVTVAALAACTEIVMLARHQSDAELRAVARQQLSWALGQYPDDPDLLSLTYSLENLDYPTDLAQDFDALFAATEAARDEFRQEDDCPHVPLNIRWVRWETAVHRVATDLGVYDPLPSQFPQPGCVD